MVIGEGLKELVEGCELRVAGVKKEFLLQVQEVFQSTVISHWEDLKGLVADCGGKRLRHAQNSCLIGLAHSPFLSPLKPYF